MWPYGAVERLPDEQAPTYADLLDEHWRALPFRRRAEILFYLTRRLFRYARVDAAAIAAARASEIRDALGDWKRRIADAATTMRWALSAEGRYAVAEFVESLATVRAARNAAPYLAAIILATLLARLDIEPRRGQHLSTVEAARLARDHRPPPCYLVDDQVWIDAEGGPIYPGRRGYRELRRDLCGF